AVRQAPWRRLPPLRPRAAARLEVLSLLRSHHYRDEARAETAARKKKRGSERPARAAGRQRRGVQEVGGAQELLPAPRDCTHLVGRRGEARLPPADRAIPSGQGSASRQGISGNGGRS